MFASQKALRGSNAIVYTLLTIGIIALINIIFSRLFIRLDLTEEKIFTVSKASKDLVAALPDRLTIKAFISSDLLPQAKGRARYLKDILAEYHTFSQGKVVWEVLDPSKSAKIKEQARRLKVHPVRLSVYEKTKASVSESYLGIAFQYGGKIESIPFVTERSHLEYQISSTIRRLTSDKMKIGFTSGHGEPRLNEELQAITRSLKNFDAQVVDLTEGKNPIDENLDILVMIGPTRQLAERAKYELDQFLMKGKSIAFFLDGMLLETPRGQESPNHVKPRVARANITGLEDQLAYYGVKLNHDTVMDRQNQRVTLPAGQGQRVVTNYPAYPIVTTMSKENPITSNLKSFVAGFASSLELLKAVSQGKGPVKGTLLAKSTEYSWRQRDVFLVTPLQVPQPTNELGPFNLAVYLQGCFKSFYAGKPVPSPGPARPPQENEPRPAGNGPKSPANTRMVVVADADLIKSRSLIRVPGNLLLLQNIVDYLAQDESMIAIRSKAQTRRPLKQVEDSTITYAKYGNIVILPLAFIIVGVLRWRWRKISRHRRTEQILKDR